LGAWGWSILAGQYTAPHVPEGKKFSMQSIAFGWVEYNGCLTIVVVAEEGRYLSTWPFSMSTSAGPSCSGNCAKWVSLHAVPFFAYPCRRKKT